MSTVSPVPAPDITVVALPAHVVYVSPDEYSETDVTIPPGFTASTRHFPTVPPVVILNKSHFTYPVPPAVGVGLRTVIPPVLRTIEVTPTASCQGNLAEILLTCPTSTMGQVYHISYLRVYA